MISTIDRRRILAACSNFRGSKPSSRQRICVRCRRHLLLRRSPMRGDRGEDLQAKPANARHRDQTVKARLPPAPQPSCAFDSANAAGSCRSVCQVRSCHRIEMAYLERRSVRLPRLGSSKLTPLIVNGESSRLAHRQHRRVSRSSQRFPLVSRRLPSSRCVGNDQAVVRSGTRIERACSHGPCLEPSRTRLRQRAEALADA